MQQEYNKLVRDKIPEIIHQAGCQCEVRVMGEDEYRQALREKLIEEAQEAAAANSENLIKELADLSEVMDAVLAIHGISWDLVLAEQARRRCERGGFQKRLKLLRTS